MDQAGRIIRRNGDEVLLSLKAPVEMYSRAYINGNVPIGKVVKILGSVREPMAILKLRDAKANLDGVESVYFR